MLLLMYTQFAFTALFLLYPGVSGALGNPAGNSNKQQTCEYGKSEHHQEWSMPFLKVDGKKIYVAHFFKANWYKANQYCRFHGLQLLSIESKEQNAALEHYIQQAGLASEHFWTSGTDLGEEGSFQWFGNGKPITYTNWNAGEPNNFVYENGEQEHCLELWDRDGKGLKWNDSPCSVLAYFVCEL